MSVAVISGSAGLIGSEAVAYFSSQGMEIVGIDNDMRSTFFGEEASTSWVRERLKREVRRQVRQIGRFHDELRALVTVHALLWEAQAD